MIAIGNQFGGPEQKGAPIQVALSKAMVIAMQNRRGNYDDGEESWINAIFIVPGSLWKPDFYGYEVGHFSRKKKGLVVKIEVPQLVADGEGIVEFIGCSLREAAKLASKHFSQKGLSFSYLNAEKIISDIEIGIADVVR